MDWWVVEVLVNTGFSGCVGEQVSALLIERQEYDCSTSIAEM